ncbi:MAG: putative transposase [Actinomycetota bacterium]|nr:putative transposase [Actinomycetota bacterium]MDQ1496798.1 putative transposase [Actinomycetota bacterium]MDQ1502276.1 putative transposase [Actinomycetota bacterium]
MLSYPLGTMRDVISSREQAPRHGPGHLLVDGTDDRLHRKAKLAFNPTAAQEAALLGLLYACCETYNAGLQERRDAWRRSRRSIGLLDQFNQITQLRGLRDDVLAWGIQPLRSSLRRVDEAYSAFYRRCAKGQSPGHPRFKSALRFDTACWDESKGWAADLSAGTLRIQGVGTVRLPQGAVRQLSRLVGRGGVPVTLTVTRRRAGTGWSWRACIGFKAVEAIKTPPAAGPDAIVGADRGVAVTVALSDGALLSVPPFLAEARDEISELLRRRDGKTVGSRAWQALNHQVAKAYRRAAQRSDNWARQTAVELAARYGVIVLEDLKLKNMIRSARGTAANPGTNVAAKQALNRKLADAALGRVRHWICVKAEEAGRRTWVVNPADTSRTCAACGHCAPWNRRSRDLFRCAACGHEHHADLNAAQNIAARGHACEAAWRAAGSPRLTRPEPKLRRRKATTEPGIARAA